jgi:Tfp pilus assembly protein PilN
MHRLRLKFPYPGQQSQIIDYSLLALGLLALASVLYLLKLSTENINYWENRVERLENQQQPNISTRHRTSHRRRDPSQQITQEIRQEIKKASEIMGQLNLPWESFFNAIEFAASKEVALLSLQPNVANQNIRINGEARNITVLLDFVEALERENVFEKAHLLNYKIKQDSPQRPIIFLITATWNQIS